MHLSGHADPDLLLCTAMSSENLTNLTNKLKVSSDESLWLERGHQGCSQNKQKEMRPLKSNELQQLLTAYFLCTTTVQLKRKGC